MSGIHGINGPTGPAAGEPIGSSRPAAPRTADEATSFAEALGAVRAAGTSGVGATAGVADNAAFVSRVRGEKTGATSDAGAMNRVVADELRRVFGSDVDPDVVAAVQKSIGDCEPMMRLFEKLG